MQRFSLNTQIFVGGSLGLLAGATLHQLNPDSVAFQNCMFVINITSTLFVDLLKMILVPLVFSSIAVGVANLRAHQQIHKVWQLTLGFFILSMSLAIVLGLSAAHGFAPGKGLNLALFQDSIQKFKPEQITFGEFSQKLIHGLFVNPFAALAQSNILAIVIFALFIGVALVTGGDRYNNILQLLQEWQELSLHIVSWIMRLSPLGIMALLAKLAATQNMELLSVVMQFIAVVIGTTLVHGVIVLPLLLYLVTKKSPLLFWRGAREALTTAFATSSSSATIPVSLRCSQQHLHVKPEIAGFVIPLGATINMDGTALYEAIAALFVANLAGIDLNLMQQLIVFLTAMISAIGAPGIPSAGMVTMILVLQSVGLPTEAIAILLPIDRLLDTVRTTVNVEGDLIGSLIVQKLTDSDKKA
jgi:Na+/H+-dicarboxylate symporter